MGFKIDIFSIPYESLLILLNLSSVDSIFIGNFQRDAREVKIRKFTSDIAVVSG